MTLSVGHWTCDLWIVGWSPALAVLCSDLEQAMYTRVPLCLCHQAVLYITWYWSEGDVDLRLRSSGDALAMCRRLSGLYTYGFKAHVRPVSYTHLTLPTIYSV